MADKKPFIITYDLCKPGQNYEELIEAIKTYNWCKIAKSAWVVTCTKTSVEIRDHLESKIDKNDKLFVGQLTSNAAWYGESKDVSQWLKDNL